MPPSSARHRERLTLGTAAVLTVAEAAALLPVCDAEARRWLRARGLVRSLVGRDVVIWGDIPDALREDASAPATPPPAPIGRLKL